ncbi:protealysin inhibitor emfourin [Streptomyces sp. Wb2n-11]|uniref:protealysin inhibitor emfourin n=1 Tax=Streptomyces sp. Wb2n-11 TaxID=1030533 RepID=UPI000A6A699F|nr:protealysin inhibitor emfourin [Streptomyces sp. Wb2n-11]
MRIAVRRTGGFAGIERYAEVDTSERPDAGEWHALAESAVAEGRGTPPVGVPDGFSYQITVDGRTVYCADPRLTEAQTRLISQVLEEGA